jgi:thiamine pyrophosphate-dependent acetolactate synthase large subunit-like protein/nitrite reductase/ring-hydroxylating ferredoxin subunit
VTDGSVWHKVAEPEGVDDGRVRAVTVDRRTVALCRVGEKFGALDNRCPHQGGPLGEGSIENGWLRCPWHGYDFDPLTGRSPEGLDDAVTTFAIEVRDDGVYVELPTRSTELRTVSDSIVETLVAWGITHVFGMVGHSNLGLAEALRRAEARGDLVYIGIRHEGAASFAASAFAKLSGRPAVCIGIAGPGSTNLLTGLYDAKVDRAPVVSLSGQVPSKVLGRGAFQDLDLAAAFSDVAQFNRTIQSGSDHSELTALAVKHALDDRTVTHLIVPDEVQVQPASSTSVNGPIGRIADRRVAPPVAVLSQAIAAVRAARRPVVIVGNGARHAVAEVIELATRLDAPVMTTFKAKGLVPDAHPLGAGVLGRSGTPVASWLMNEADLLIVVGASFSNHTGIAPYKRIVQIDDDHAAIGRFHAVDVGVLGDAAVTLAAIVDALDSSGSAQRLDQRPDLAERWSLWRGEKARRVTDHSPVGVGSAAIFEALSRHCPSDAVMCVDVGNNTYSFGRYFETSGQDVLMSGYLGSIGFGYPAALGAWAAAPSRPIVAITGDGGFGQYLAEVTTAVKYGIPVRHVLLDNSVLGKISKEQRAAEYDVWQTGLHNPDFAAYATLCGAVGVSVEHRDELDGAFADLFSATGPATVAIRCDPELI